MKTDVEFLDWLENLARTKARIDPDFKDRRVHLSASQGTRIWQLANRGIVGGCGLPGSWYRCDTLLDRWIPRARQRIADDVTRKLTTR